MSDRNSGGRDGDLMKSLGRQVLDLPCLAEERRAQEPRNLEGTESGVMGASLVWISGCSRRIRWFREVKRRGLLQSSHPVNSNSIEINSCRNNT